MVTFTFNFKTYIFFPRWRQYGRSRRGCGGDFITIRGGTEFFWVSHMTVNNHFLLHIYYHSGWYFDKIQMMLHRLELQRHLKNCCVGVVYKYQYMVVRLR